MPRGPPSLLFSSLLRLSAGTELGSGSSRPCSLSPKGHGRGWGLLLCSGSLAAGAPGAQPGPLTWGAPRPGQRGRGKACPVRP